MTLRLYYDDSYLTDFHATVVATSEDHRRVVLDQSAFYPSSGGQPHDLGWLNGIPVTDVLDEGDRVVHLLAGPLEAESVKGQVALPRRFDHMQQHTGQHLLSAVLVQLFGIPTVSFHMGSDSSSIDVGAASLDVAQIRAVEQRANEIVFENRSVSVSYSDSGAASDLRKPSEREGILRIISIEGLDRSACGGTHVKQTGEIGPILIRKMEKVRGNTRLEFLCGSRSVRRARADFESLTAIAQAFSSTLDDAPQMVIASLARLQESEKIRQRMAADLAQSRGRNLYGETLPGPDGIRRFLKQITTGGIDEELRLEAQSFVAQPKAVFVAACENPVSILLAASADSGFQAGAWLGPRLKQAGGRGGGNAQLAQGSLPDRQALKAILHAIGFVS